MKHFRLEDYQRAELIRLAKFEEQISKSSDYKNTKCAFSYRPENTVQRELLALEALRLVQSGTSSKSRPSVIISDFAYEYLYDELNRESDRQAQRRHDTQMIALAVSFSVVSAIIGFVIGSLL